MDHDDAVRTNAIERYWLGELTVNERLEFEEHFFGCTHCSEELLATQAFAQNALAVWKEEDEKPAEQESSFRESWRRKWVRWFLMPVPAWVPVSAALVLVGFIAFQWAVVFPSYRSAGSASQAVMAAALHPLSRGEPQVVAVPARASVYILTLDIGDPSVGEYECEIRNASGQLCVRISVPVARRSSQINVLVNVRDTPPGDYTLLLKKAAGQQEAGQYRFVVQTLREDGT